MDSGKIKKLHVQILEFYVTHKRKVTFVSIKDQIIGYMNEFSWAIDIWRECNKLLTWHEKKSLFHVQFIPPPLILSQLGKRNSGS